MKAEQNHAEIPGSHRISHGLLDASRPLSFSFNDKRYPALQGDTLASALLANGQKLIGRSFKYHRPRGIFSAGPEEPNALVELGSGAHREPNTRATVIELIDGMQAKSQNHRGPLNFDVMAINDYLSPFLTAGFYYKTFMWPKAFWEKLYEPVIRAAAGLGSLSGEADPSSYDKGFLHCDLLVIGAGPAGLSAALTAGRAGLRIIVADEDFLPGGRLNHDQCVVDDRPGSQWAAEAVSELDSLPNVRFMSRTTVYGAYDHGIYGALEQMTDRTVASAHKQNATSNQSPKQILWRIYTQQALLCAGSTERSIAFGNNDRPGIVLAASVRAYLNRYGVAAGQQSVVFTNNDDGWRTACDLHAIGALAGVVDSRQAPAPFDLSDVPVFMGDEIIDTGGRLCIKQVKLRSGEILKCDSLAVSGGWNPNVHLTCHQRGRPVWDESLAAFVPGGELPRGMQVAGAARGQMSLQAALQSGHDMAASAAERSGKKLTNRSVPVASAESTKLSALWRVRESTSRCWIDLQNDVTSKDLGLSFQEGFRSVEHLKRYTTLGMATDQGKTSNVLGLAILAEISGRSIPETGSTIFRPPYTPVPIGAFAGRSRGRHFRPFRHTPTHAWSEANGASFVEAGNWLRAQWYAKPEETHWRQSVDREVTATRTSVGICDVTTLGKIDIQGRDAGRFLDKVYANTFSTLAVGKVRYGLMLREDGFVMDDGTTARFSETHFVMTTTTANAVSVFRHLEFCRQCLWPQLDVHLISATEQWAQIAVAGPKSRALLSKLVDPPFDIGNDALPYMSCAALSVCGGTPARLFRISFSGELAYELAVPARFGQSLMDRLMQSGQSFDVTPYGTEALGVMRIEKGHVAGNELNGQTAAVHIGLGRMVSKKKDCIGNILSQRPALNSDDGIRLVGLVPENKQDPIKAGAHFIAKDVSATLENDQGWMSSVAYSPSLGSMIGLGFIKNGDQRIGETVVAADPLRDENFSVTITSPHFIDPDGERLRV